MKRILFPLLVIAALLIVKPVMAQPKTPDVPNNIPTPPNAPEAPKAPPIPEKDGDYPDPEIPGVRVRVFVHAPKPTPTPVVTACTDPDGSAVVGKTGWKLNGSVVYNLNPSSAPTTLGTSNLVNLVSKAFQTWQNYANGKVAFSRGTDTIAIRSAYDGKNIVAWGQTNNSTLAVTYTRYYTSTGQVVDVDTIFNKRMAWKWTDPTVYACSQYTNAYDAQDILTHELGHWLGLNDHYTSNYVNHTMYGYGSLGETKKDTLATGDILGLGSIY
jgi:hypothetical protein